MSRISSLTETTGFRSPQNTGTGAAGGDVAAFWDEPADASAATIRTAAQQARACRKWLLFIPPPGHLDAARLLPRPARKMRVVLLVFDAVVLEEVRVRQQLFDDVERDGPGERLRIGDRDG